MAATASEIFSFLNEHPTFSIERHEISLSAFETLRCNLRAIFVKLREGGDPEAEEGADRLRSMLSEWLTVPIPFDDSVLRQVEAFGTPNEIEARWGRDIRSNYENALIGAQRIRQIENPIRTTLRSLILDLKANGRIFKVYCHRTARAHFESLLVATDTRAFGQDDFLHSVRDYRDSGIFDTLIKVGPLRSWGWGSAPDAIKSAPRFGTLIQIVWAGCGDEPGFGYDPIAPPADMPVVGTEAVSHEEALVSRASWTPHIVRSGDADVAQSEELLVEDDFQVFGRLSPTGEKRRAILVQIGSQHGVLYPLHSQVLSFDPTPNIQIPISKRLPGESLVAGIFIIRRLLGDVDLGGQQVENDHYSQIWKSHLDEARQNDLDGLVNRLRAAGIGLTCLPAAIRNWCVASTTVIHAPHKQRHFELLIEVLGLGSDSTAESNSYRIPWWQRAWNEIRRSRGEAIQAGIHGQEVLDEECLTALRDLLPTIRKRASDEAEFSVTLPANNPLQGTFLFNKVIQFEEGFLAPDTELKVIRDLGTIEQWRA